MADWMRWLALACFSWILWMDQTVYTLPDNRHQPQEPVAAEGAKAPDPPTRRPPDQGRVRRAQHGASEAGAAGAEGGGGAAERPTGATAGLSGSPPILLHADRR